MTSWALDSASFAIGIAACLIVSWIGYHIVRIVEARQKEYEIWIRTLSAPSPSETWWGEVAKTQPPTPSEGEEWVRLKPQSPPDTPNS